MNSGSLPGGALARAISTNNLKQIGLALHVYHQAFDSLPPGGTFDRRGRPLVSWQTTILPYLEVGDLHDRTDLSIPWNDLRNAHAYQIEVPQYLRPGIPTTRNAAGYALSHYAANVYMLGGDHPRKFEEVSDGTANTLMAGEVAAEFKAWGDPTNWRDPTLGFNRTPGFRQPVLYGVNFLMVDGSVRFIKNTSSRACSRPCQHPPGVRRFRPTNTRSA